MSEITNADEFLLGQLDCKNGEGECYGRHPDYYRGFETQYVKEQNETNFSTQQNEAIYEH